MRKSGLRVPNIKNQDNINNNDNPSHTKPSHQSTRVEGSGQKIKTPTTRRNRSTRSTDASFYNASQSIDAFDRRVDDARAKEGISKSIDPFDRRVDEARSKEGIEMPKTRGKKGRGKEQRKRRCKRLGGGAVVVVIEKKIPGATTNL